MKPEKDGATGRDAGHGTAAAANDDRIEGAGPLRGWDPFEVWRTRVRDERNRRQRPPGPPIPKT